MPLHFLTVQIAQAASAGPATGGIGSPLDHGLGTNAAASTNPLPTPQGRCFGDWFWRWFTTPMTAHPVHGGPLGFSFAAMGCCVRATHGREVEAFPAMLATQHKALASMRNPALSAFGSLRRLQPKILLGFRMFF